MLKIVILGENSFDFLNDLLAMNFKYNVENRYEWKNFIFFSILAESPYHYLYNVYLKEADIVIVPTENCESLHMPMIRTFSKSAVEILSMEKPKNEIMQILENRSEKSSKNFVCCC